MHSNKSFSVLLRSALTNKALLIAAFMGAASGLPLLLTKSTLKIWLREEGIDLATIGFIAYLGAPYTLKFLWSPFIDRFKIFSFGRRRSWLLLSQVLLVISIALMGFANPANSLTPVAFIAFFICFFSATQDIVVDAYRRETLTDNELGLGSALYVYGYRLALWIARTVPLLVAQFYSWQAAYFSMAALMSLNLITTFFADEPEEPSDAPSTITQSFIQPVKDFFTRLGTGHAILVLAFILFYKLGDAYASVLTSPFYIDLGFSKAEIVSIDGSIGFFAQFIGLFLGSTIILRIGITSSLWFFGFLQMLSTAGFALLGFVGHNMYLFGAVVGFENASSGMGTAAFLAYMASLTNKANTATQYALMTSIMAIPMTILSGTSGLLAEAVGWNKFFIICTLAAIPGLILLKLILKLEKT